MRFALRNKDKLVNAFGIEAHQLLLDSLKDYARNHEDVSVEEVNQAIIDEKISVSQVEKALASFLEKGAGRKSPCDNCRDFYDNEYGSCAFGCSKLREFEGREPDYDLLG